MERMRVVAVCSSTSYSGTEKWILRACEELQVRGHEVVMMSRNPQIFGGRANRQFPIGRISSFGMADKFTILRLADVFKRRADVVIVTRVVDYWLAGIAARMAKVPVLLRLGVVRRMRDDYLFDKWRYGKLSSEILVNANAIRETLLETEWLKDKPIHVIYNGVDAPGPLAERHKLLMRQQLNVHEGSTLILGAGRLAAEKRWGWLILAAAELRKVTDNFQVRIFGEGAERHTLERLVKELKLDRHVFLPGFSRDVSQWTAAADIAALPSSNEGISNTMLESMGRGIPVVATESGGVTEFFEDGKNILLTDRNDYDAFSKRLIGAVQDFELRKSISENALSVVSENFTWERMGSQLENLLSDIIGKQS